jgi:acyl-CoA hydrolase
MSIYQKIAAVTIKVLGRDNAFKYGFNLSPMYRRSTARVVKVTKDMLQINIKLPISYKNKNYVNSIFGGSMFSATDPIAMIQLISILGEDYVVWDKSAEIFFKRPARESLYAEFVFTAEEIASIQLKVAAENEIDITKKIALTNKNKTITFCEVHKVIYITTKKYYKTKRRNRVSRQ